MKNVVIAGTSRPKLGKRGTKDDRNAGLVPCVLYGGTENIHFSVSQVNLRPIVYTPDFHTIELQVEGKSYTSILKDLQFHPVTDSLLHIDFLQLVDDKPVILELPVRLVGTAKGVKAGGRLLIKVRKLKVKAFPKDLVSEIVVNVENLEVGKSLRVSEIQLENIQILNSPSIPIASVEITRALKSAAAAQQAATKGGKKK